MNIAEVNRRVEDIRVMAGDPEIAHSAEDDLYLAVLTAISEGASDPSGLAAAALNAASISFPRWYA